MPFTKKSLYLSVPTKAYQFCIEYFGVDINKAQQLIGKRRILQHGTPVVSPGTWLEGEIEVIEYQGVTPTLRPIFQTGEFAIYDKPYGFDSMPRNRTSPNSIVDEARGRFGAEANIVHRLDFETSGLIMVSKNKPTERLLKRLLEQKEIAKTYQAVVRGRIKEATIIDARIEVNDDYSTSKHKGFVDNGGKESLTSIKPILYCASRDITLIEAKPLTGRLNQIRIHLSHIGHAILGDPIYGTSFELSNRYLDGMFNAYDRDKYFGASRLMLHAYALEFSLEHHYRITSQLNFIKDFYEEPLD